MATGLLNSIGSFFSPSQNSAHSSPGNSGESSGDSGVVSYGNDGQQIQPTQPENQNTNSNSNQNSNSPQTQSLESLLFDPIDPAPEGRPDTSNSPKNPNNQTNQPDSGPSEIAPGFTPENLLATLRAVPYENAVPAELLESALGGDAKSMHQVLANVAQLSSAVAIQQSLQMFKAQMDQRFQEYDSTLDTKVTGNEFNKILSDPQFSNPYIQPLAKDLISRIRERDPKASPQQVKELLPKLIEHAMKSSQPSFQNNSTQGEGVRSIPNSQSFDNLF